LVDNPDREKIIKEIELLQKKYEEYNNKYGIDGIKKLSEADIKKDFVNPLFQALGWKIDNSWEYDEETYVRGAGFVDISIWIEDPTAPGKRVPKIFVETKKFGKIESVTEREKQIDLYSKKIVSDWTPEERQVLNYCAQAKIKWAVLTNYEKFRVFNAYNGITILNIDSPHQYLERLEDLLYLSKEAIISRRIEELEQREERPDIDEGFLALMETWRKVLAVNIYEKNHNLTLEQVKDATQRILDRFVIVRSAEDRLILDSPDLMKDTYDYWLKHSQFGSLSDMFFGHNQIFYNFDRIYNSSIFARGHISETITIDDKVLGNIIAGLYLVNFRKFPSDVLGRTYESYLGGSFIIENGELIVKSSIETRKSGGVYYTPRYIVDHIVKKALIDLLEPIWIQTLELIKKKDFSGAEMKFSEFSEVTVLDPSMGSGTFLISVFSVFKEYYEKYNRAISSAREEIIKSATNGLEGYSYLPSEVKKYRQKILKENIYGIDLDQQATEIGAVNLMLQALERGEKLPLILGENIKSGNSLIPGKVERNLFIPYKKEIATLIQIRHKLKESEEESLKKNLMDEEKEIKNSLVLQINKALNIEEKLQASKPFIIEIEFPEVFFKEDGSLKDNAGFSIVLGNPPYGASFTREEKKFIEDRFFCRGSDNSAEYFLEQAINLARDDGIIGMVVPKTIAFYSEWRDIRSLIILKSRILDLMDLGLGFSNVNYEEIIIIFRKDAEDVGTVTIEEARPLKMYSPKKTIVDLGTIDQALMKVATTIIFKPVSDEESQLILKMNSQSYKFEEIFDRTFRGLYIPDEQKMKLGKGHYKFVNKVPDVGRYHIKNIVDIDLGSNEKWLKDAKKIMVPRIFLKVMRGKRLIANFDDGSLLTTEKLVNVVLKKETKYSLPFLTALLNSPLLSFYIEKVVFSGTTETSRVLDYPYIKDLPIRKIIFLTPQDKLSSFVENFKQLYTRLINDELEFSYILGFTKDLLDNDYSDVVHDIISFLAEQMVILLKQKEVVFDTFNVMLKKFRQDAEYRPLREYVDIKMIREMKDIKNLESFSKGPEQTNNYYIELTGIRELIDYKQRGLVVKVNVKETKGAIMLSILTNSEKEYKDMLEIPINDEMILQYFLLAIKLDLRNNARRKFWSGSRIYEVLDRIMIPRSVPNIEKDVKNIKFLMESFNDTIKKIIASNFRSSFVQTYKITKIEKTISFTDKLIDMIVYQLYGLTEREQMIVEAFGSQTQW